MRIRLVSAIIIAILIALLIFFHAKKVLKVLGIIVGAIVLIFIIAMIFTSGLPKAANTMFADIKDGKVEQAYSTTAEGFQEATTLEQFQAFVQGTKLTTFKSVSWTEREVVNSQGILKGTVTLSDDSKLPFEINLIKEDGQWKIFTINVPQGGLEDGAVATGTSQIPTQEATTIMVQKAMELFTNAVNSANFTTFYNTIAKTRQQQTTAADLLKAFKVFIDNKIDLSFTTTMEPTYAAVPTIDNNGVLTVQGSFAAQDGTILFEQKYFQENNEWKLFGFNVQVK